MLFGVQILFHYQALFLKAIFSKQFLLHLCHAGKILMFAYPTLSILTDLPACHYNTSI